MQITLTGYADLISIHALREEGDEFIDFILEALSNFYPRPPRGGRPTSSSSRLACSGFLSTPSARRATCKLRNLRDFEAISIHALREEGDMQLALLTPPLTISIHALREEGDTATRSRPATTRYFYPRPPRGGRPCRSLSPATLT